MMVCEYPVLRNPFQLPGAQRVGVPPAEEWARRIGISRIEHDRDRAKHIKHGWVLGPPSYVEEGNIDEWKSLMGEWRSEIHFSPDGDE